MSNFSLEDYFKKHESDTDGYKYLPLCHTTSEGYFVSILNSKALAPTPCNVYANESLIYFFYGKAAYLIDKPNLQNVGRECPITLLYKFDDVLNIQIKRLLPFDSGGFDYYDFPDGTSREMFEMKNLSDGAKLAQLIQLIYGGNKEYINETIQHSKLQSESEKSWAIKKIADFYYSGRPKLKEDKIGLNSKSKVGKQAITFELQVDKSLSCSPWMIFFPYELLTDRNAFWTPEKITDVFPGVEIVIYNKPGDNESQTNDGMENEVRLRNKVRERVIEYLS